MHAKLYCDGGNVGRNPSPTVYWSVGREHEDGRIELLTERHVSDQGHSNNFAEYGALIEALGHAANMKGLRSVAIHSDSQLIVNQFNGRWKITGDELRTLCAAAQASAEFLMNAGVRVEVLWVRREENVRVLGH